jgi:DNA-binding transcriptional LysR family regulator
MNNSRLEQLRIRQLRLLVMLGQGHTLSQCALALHVTAAAASLMLTELESSLGAALFERDRRGARATAAGLKLAQRAQVLLAEFARFESEASSQLSASPELSIDLGVIPQAMIERVPSVARHMAAAYPGSLRVRQGTSSELIAAVQSGQLSAAIARINPAAGSQDWQGLQMQLLGQESAAIAVPLNHPLANKRRITSADLAALQWVLPEPSSYIRRVLEQHLALHAPAEDHTGKPSSMQVAIQVDTNVHALWCAAQSQHLAAAGPLSLIEGTGKQWGLKALPVKLGEPIELGLFYRASQLRLPAFQSLLEAIAR